MSADKIILEELKNEAIDSLDEKLKSMNAALSGQAIFGDDRERIFAQIRMDAHSIKAVASAYEVSSLKAITHRCEDFLFDVKKGEDLHIPSVQIFVDRMSDAFEAWVYGRDFDVSEVSRSLPAKGSFNENEITVSNIEVMLVMEPGIATRIITRELLECGYRMVNVASTIDAIQLVPSMRPDMVIISREMPELSGIDLVCALRAMPITRNIPLALITAEEKTSDKLEDLPENVPVLRKGPQFGDDVADVFVQLDIL